MEFEVLIKAIEDYAECKTVDELVEAKINLLRTFEFFKAKKDSVKDINNKFDDLKNKLNLKTFKLEMK